MDAATPEQRSRSLERVIAQHRCAAVLLQIFDASSTAVIDKLNTGCLQKIRGVQRRDLVKTTSDAIETIPDATETEPSASAFHRRCLPYAHSRKQKAESRKEQDD